jgi:hypothetical protein
MDRETRNLALIAAGVGVAYYVLRKSYDAAKAAVVAGGQAALNVPTLGVNLWPDPNTGANVPVGFPNGHTYYLPAGLFQTNWISDFFGGATLTVDANNPQGIPGGKYALETGADGSRFAVPA